MPHIQVTIGGKHYRLACNAGEEAELVELSVYLDARLSEMVEAFPHREDPRILVMTALSLVDELFKLRKSLEAQKTQADRFERAIAETIPKLEALCKMLDVDAIDK